MVVAAYTAVVVVSSTVHCKLAQQPNWAGGRFVRETNHSTISTINLVKPY